VPVRRSPPGVPVRARGRLAPCDRTTPRTRSTRTKPALWPGDPAVDRDSTSCVRLASRVGHRRRFSPCRG
jgi:hypothetical protein